MTRTAFTSFLLLMGIGFVVSIWSMSPTARWVPLLIALPTVALLSIQSLRELVTRTVQANDIRREVRVIIWLLALPIMVYVLGFLVAVPIYLLVYLRRRASLAWRQALSSAVIAALMLFALQRFLELQMYGGLLWNWLL